MNNWNSHSADIEWVDEAYQLLIEIARCSLSELPKLPENFSQKALPLIQKVQSIQESGQGPGHHSPWQHRDREWVDRVGELLIEITRISLAEHPKLPENLAQRVLALAEQAQSIKETAVDNSSMVLVAEADTSLLPPDSLLNLLEESLKVQRAKSSNRDAPEWQELLALLNVVQGIYKKIQERS